MSKILSKKQRDCEKTKRYQSTKRGHISNYLKRIKRRALDKGLPYDLNLDYLESIATDFCPIFKTPFIWGLYKAGTTHKGTATVDRIVPELGYVKGNVIFISHQANTIKSNATENELYAVADWLHDKRKEVLNAFKGQPASVSTKYFAKSQNDSQLGAVHGAGVRENCDGANHHRGESEGQDVGDSTEESCRICMGARGEELGALEWSEMRASYGNSGESDESIAKRLGCVCNKFGKRGVASGQLAFEGF